jgi:hypothetical protein
MEIEIPFTGYILIVSTPKESTILIKSQKKSSWCLKPRALTS